MNNKGQALVEYVLIIVVISVTIMGVVKIFGGRLVDKFTESMCPIFNQVYEKGDKPGEGKCVDSN